MAKARSRMEAAFMGECFFMAGQEHSGTPPLPDL
jgi:hypothetical protein